MHTVIQLLMIHNLFHSLLHKKTKTRWEIDKRNFQEEKILIHKSTAKAFGKCT
uniref:Uncharacterized protein n=1 Tax=Rhizophora mucronata TaxID=61149 RepID=A0A2P2PPB7_RHIMU